MLSYVTPPHWVGKSADEIRRECHSRIKAMGQLKILRWSYLPFCLAEGCWDIADSIIDIAIQMRLDKTKPVSRAIRTLRRNYEIVRQKTTHSDNITARIAQEGELDNYLGMETCDRERIRDMYDAIKKSAAETYPLLNEDYIVLLCAVYHCHIMLQVLYRYTEKQTELVRKEIGLPHLDSILPDEVYTLDKLILQFRGDKPVTIPNKESIINSIVDDMMDAQFTDLDESEQ